MKRFVKMIAALSFAALTFSSCLSGTCDCDRPTTGQSGTQNGTNWQILTFNVKSSDWKVASDNDGYNAFYMAELSVPELKANILKDGIMMSYIYLDGNQEALPYVRHFEQWTTENGEDYQFLWTQTTDIEYSVGKAYIYTTISDFPFDPSNSAQVSEFNPGDMSFRVVLLW